MAGPIDYDQALLDPGAVFRTPEEVIERSDLSKAQKIEILRRWEYDANEMEVAEEEGMPGESNHLLRRIVLALEQLTGDAAPAHGAPTKQGG